MVVERTYNVPLRKEWLKVPRYLRTQKAVKALKQFLKKHMKSEEVRIGRYLNLHLWKHGIKNPPHHVKINVVKDDKGIVKAELVGAPVEKEEKKGKTKEEKKEKQEKKEKPGEKPKEGGKESKEKEENKEKGTKEKGTNDNQSKVPSKA